MRSTTKPLTLSGCRRRRLSRGRHAHTVRASIRVQATECRTHRTRISLELVQVLLPCCGGYRFLCSGAITSVLVTITKPNYRVTWKNYEVRNPAGHKRRLASTLLLGSARSRSGTYKRDEAARHHVLHPLLTSKLQTMGGGPRCGGRRGS
ncbi:hypothetical protein VUR80DRAFT_1104 [Thermomyces stellatus]